MKKIYTDNPYTLRLDTNEDLSAVTEPKLIYRKEDGTVDEVSGSVSGTKIVAEVSGAVNDEAGIWTWKSSCIFSGDTNPTTGRAVTLKVLEDWARV